MSLMFARSVAAMVNTGLWVPAHSAANLLESSPCHASASCEASPSILFISVVISSDSPCRMRAWASTTSGFMPSHELPPPLLLICFPFEGRAHIGHTRSYVLCWALSMGSTPLVRQGHLEHLGVTALHKEPATVGHVRAVECREAGAEDRLPLDPLRLQCQARPRGLHQARQPEAGAEEHGLALGHDEMVVVDTGLDQTRQARLRRGTCQVIHAFDDHR